ncbi:hypothetical protein BH11PLA2_BH11PLA2_44300 [soil metagenome]
MFRSMTVLGLLVLASANARADFITSNPTVVKAGAGVTVTPAGSYDVASGRTYRVYVEYLVPNGAGGFVAFAGVAPYTIALPVKAKGAVGPFNYTGVATAIPNAPSPLYVRVTLQIQSVLTGAWSDVTSSTSTVN